MIRLLLYADSETKCDLHTLAMLFLYFLYCPNVKVFHCSKLAKTIFIIKLFQSLFWFLRKMLVESPNPFVTFSFNQSAKLIHESKSQIHRYVISWIFLIIFNLTNLTIINQLLLPIINDYWFTTKEMANFCFLDKKGVSAMSIK